MRFLSLSVFLFVAAFGTAAAAAKADGQVRTYYIAADEVTWNYAPTGVDQVTGKPFDAMERPYAVQDAH
ncbi:MAG: hypothetical protein JO078_04005, partial [Candidatus Eremiobacteraeota bacterium]|nr:hypothetical protein [Candidatus Eremiobacteraeota bacterium]